MRKNDLFAAATLVVAAVFFSGCRSETITAPEGAEIVVTASPGTIPAIGGSSVIDVDVLEGGAPVRIGTIVRLSTSLGTLDQSEVETDSSGHARTTLRSTGAAGTASVVARSGGADAATVEVTIADADTMQVEFSSPNPDRIDAMTGTSLVRARVQRVGDNSPMAGVRIDFTTTGASVILQSPSVVSDATGNVETIVLANQATGTTTIRATCAAANCSVPGNAQLTLVDSPSSLILGADPTSLSVGSVTSSIKITATVLGKVPPSSFLSGATVVFTTATPGTFTGGQKTISGITGSSGKVEVTLQLTPAEQAEARDGVGIVVEAETVGFDENRVEGSITIPVS